MPGAWEIVHDTNVLVGILHTDATTVSWGLGLRAMRWPGKFQVPMLLAGMPYDMARNTACMHALDLGADYMFFLDSDVVVPPDTIERLIALNMPITSGMYCRRSPPEGVPVMIRDGQWITEFPKDALLEVDLVGAGCLLIHTDVLRALPPQRPGKHWFDWRVDMKSVMPAGECLSEDFTFNVHARRHGFKTVVDTSIQCRHIGFAESRLKSFRPLEAPHAG